MISVCSTDGDIKPLRFRMEDEGHRLCTVPITQVVCSKPLQYAGVDSIQYLCKSVVEGKEKLFDLRYTVRTHRWTLFRVVY
jgi:hypothetical protein